MVRKSRIFIFVFVVCCLLSIVTVSTVEAATLQFSPASGTFTTGTAMPVQIKVDTLSVDTTSTDAVIKFDSTLLSVDSVSYGSFYPTVLHSQQTDKLFVSGMVSNPGSVINGSGVLATVNFIPLTAGTTIVSFDCTTGQTNDSNVTKNDTNATDILDCSVLVNASYTIQGTSVATPTPTPGVATTSTPTPTTGPTTPTPVITQIPDAGLLDIVSLFPRLMMGLVFLIIGLVPLMI